MTTPKPHGPDSGTPTDSRVPSAAAVTASGPWPNAYRHKTCICGCGIGLHAIRANGSRGACSVSRGPKAIPCPCKSYEEAT